MSRPNLHFTYEPHSSLYGDMCFYCGQYADTIDHVPPLSLLNFYSNYYRFLFKACRECNHALGARFLPTPISRLEYLIKKYKKKYKKSLSIPIWTNDELRYLKGSLKKYIEESIKEKNKIQVRIRFLDKTLNELLGDK